MLYSIFSLLLDVIAGLVGGACLLRWYMQWRRVPFGNPIGQFVMAVSDWLVLPLRRWLPIRMGWDLASLLGAYLVEFTQYALLWLFADMSSSAGLAVPLLACFGVLRMVISGLTGLLIVYAVLSWFQPGRSMLADTLDRLCQPLLQPIRRFTPLVGGVDLSPLVLLVLLQIAAMVLGSVQFGVLH